MITVRQIERFWTAKAYDKLLSELCSHRPDTFFGLEKELSRAVPVAALTILRLDELSQSHVPLYGRLLRTILATQERDGGWGDVVTTALCLRALLCGRGQGTAIDHGIMYLASLQRDEGIWPSIPMRRMPGDVAVSAFVLHQLGDQSQFCSAVRFGDAVAWFNAHWRQMDETSLKLWERASRRCGMRGSVQQSGRLFAQGAARGQN